MTPDSPLGLDAAKTRREVLKMAGAGALSVGALGALSACGSSSTTNPTTTAPTAAPKRGGTLRVGLTGGSVNDTLDPPAATTPPSYAASRLLFDTLALYDADCNPELSLATEITPNRDATSWTIRLRDGVTFHDGRPLTADDLIFTFHYVTNPKLAAVYAPLLSPVDLGGLRKIDKLTVEVPCKTPYSILADVVTYSSWFSILPTNFDLKKPVGTGPFKFVSFTPGQQLVVTRNPDYWRSGQPYVDKVVITSYADETSSVSALVAKQVDMISLLSAASANEAKSGGAQVVVSETGGWTPIVMRMDIPPFNNPMVREAVKLLVDREQMLSVIFSGMGTVANDLFSPFDPGFNHSLPQRPHDPEKAKALLKKAGASGLTVNFVTGPIYSGTVQLAQVFAQQATAAGMNVNVQQRSNANFYGPDWLKYQLTTDYWSYCTYLAQVPQNMMPGMFDETHMNDPRYNALFKRALAEPDEDRRIPLIHEMQAIEWQSDGYCIPYYYPLIEAHGSNLQGMKPDKSGVSIGNWREFRTVYFT